MRRTFLTILLALGLTGAAKPKAPTIRWIEDDYPKALAQAKAAKLPLVVDAWAGWCHTCISMQSFVLEDPSLQAMAGRFVWLQLDSDKPVNAAFFAKFPVNALPTYLVIDPAAEAISGRWVGSGSVPEMRTFLTDGEKATQLAAKLPPGDPLALLRDGDRAEQQGKPADAADLYGKAIAAAPKGWAHAGQAFGNQVMALSEAKSWDRCVEVATAGLGADHSVGPVTAAQIAYGGCAGNLPADAKSKAEASLETWLWTAATDPAAPLSADDRGDVLGDIRDARDARGDKAGAEAAAKKQLEILDKAAASAPDALAASSFNSARARAMLYLGRGTDAVAMLEKSEKALPGVADPPMRLARVYAELGRDADAIGALDRAIPNAGPKIRVSLQAMKSDLLEKGGKHAEACKALSEAMSTLKDLPDPQKNADMKAGLEQKLAACGAPTSR